MMSAGDPPEPWPPTLGEPMPGAHGAVGIQEKLVAYCLNTDHRVGGPKAQGFLRLLGIGLADVEYLADALRTGILREPVRDVRDNPPFGVLREVRIHVGGLREWRTRVVAVTTSWELRHVDDRPRLVTAYVDG